MVANKNIITRSSYFVLSLGAISTFILFLYTSELWIKNAIELKALAWLSWVVSPYLLLLFAVWFFRKNKIIRNVLFVGTLLIVLPGIIGYIDAFFIHMDAQGGLIFIFLPLYQICLTGIFILIAVFIFCMQKFKGKRRQTSSTKLVLR